jgi:hypothetical protein
MWRKFSAVLAVVTVAGTMVAASAGDAAAWYRHHHHHNNGAFIGGLAVGALALGALGADAYYHDDDYGGDRCFRGRPRCHWVRGDCYRDRWGDYQCDGGYRRCYRPLICE